MLDQAIMRFNFKNLPIAAIEHEGDLWIPAEDIGRALDYADPVTAMRNLFNRNKEELERYSLVLKLPVSGDSEPPAGVSEGGIEPLETGGSRLKLSREVGGGDSEDVIQLRGVRCYNKTGLMVVTMLSSQPRAAEFRAAAAKVLDAYFRGELALSGAGQKEQLLINCIREARYGNPVAIHTLIERFGYPATIRREVKGELLRRALRDTSQSPELVDWFIESFLARLREEIESKQAGPLLAAIRSRPPGYSVWKEIEEPDAVWTLRHRPSDLYTLVCPIAEAEEVDLDVTSQRFTRWVGYLAPKLKAAGWERAQSSRSKGWDVFCLRLLKAN